MSDKRGRTLAAKPQNREAITQNTVRRLLQGTPEDRIIWDSGNNSVRGFGLRLTAAGTVSFILNYYFDGKERRYSVGRHPEWTVDAARKEAMALRVNIDNGNDPVMSRKAERDARMSEPTFKALADAYLRDAATRKRESSLYDDRRMLGLNDDGTPKSDDDEAMRKKRILFVLGDRRLSEIKRDDIVRFHNSLKETPYQANRVLALLSAIFSFGIKSEWIEKNPAKGLPKFGEEKRKRYLSIEEMQRFREALDNYPHQDSANALRLLLLTGSRSNEVLSAQWEEFDFSRSEWIKPSHHTKQKQTEHLPLSSEASKLLESMAPENLSGPLFVGRDGKGNRISLRRPWIAACKAAGLVTVEEVERKDKNEKAIIGNDGKPRITKRYVPTLRVHDLRHSYASFLISNGVSLQVVGKLLGHTQASTTMRYAHVHDEAQRSAANVFGAIYSKKTPKAKTRRA